MPASEKRTGEEDAGAARAVSSKLSKYLDPKLLSKIERLDLKARFVVEGFIAGMHKSPYHGFSVEFSQHREYVPGDDLRHLDWKVFSRQDKYYIKQYEEETNFVCHVLLDASESMLYGSGALTKLEYAKYVTASLAYLITGQSDAIGVGIFDKEIRSYIPPGMSEGHVHTIAEQLEKLHPEKKTGVGHILHQFAERIGRRGICIIISDLFDNVDEILSGVQHLRFLGHEVILFHVLDPYEIAFPFDGLVKFEGLEGYPDLLCQPRMLKESYLEELGKFRKALEVGCSVQRSEYVLMSTETTLDVALTSYLVSRLRKWSRRG